MRLLPPSDMAALANVYRELAANMHRAFKALDVTAAFEPGGSLSPPPGIMTATGSALRVRPSTICRL
ncbi:MAG: hypothetical protein VX223_09100, partial [Myxococcota bacterium]|nr:hypothetical protein [Myxococcota bacterium]